MWTITEVCERTGLSARTVRYYEEIRLLPDVRRRSNGRRVYGADDLERLGDLLAAHLADVDRRLAELGDLRDELLRYRNHVDERVVEAGETPVAENAKSRDSPRSKKERMTG